MTITLNRGKVYGRLSDVSLRMDRKGTRFVRCRVEACGRDGSVLFSREVVAYRDGPVALLLALGNGAPVWIAGVEVDVPRNGGKTTVRMLRALDVRDSSSKVSQAQATPA